MSVTFARTESDFGIGHRFRPKTNRSVNGRILHKELKGFEVGIAAALDLDRKQAITTAVVEKIDLGLRVASLANPKVPLF